MARLVKRQRLAKTGVVGVRVAKARTKAERLVWEQLEKAHKTVKQVLREESRGEVVGADILNFRLRS